LDHRQIPLIVDQPKNLSQIVEEPGTADEYPRGTLVRLEQRMGLAVFLAQYLFVVITVYEGVALFYLPQNELLYSHIFGRSLLD
jgi:hypothetical protein